ncbi:hypothetical protein SNEBB_000473 [Seison nebaliae]|nr:hypothetical protein SNEBB_000473 [Seison nebaliae]
MVLLNVKIGDKSRFLFETTCDALVSDVLNEVCSLTNDCLKIERICSEIPLLMESGVVMPLNMQGLTDDQIVDLKLVDEWKETCIPSGGYEEGKDQYGRRNGRAPLDKMKSVLERAINDGKRLISMKNVSQGTILTKEHIKESLNILKGAITIVYPMNLPPHDPIRMELENREDLSGTQASKDVLPQPYKENIKLWFCGKELKINNKLSDHIGWNEKTKCVIKIGRKESGAPGREPIINEEEQKQLMSHYYKKEQEDKRVREHEMHNDSDHYLNSPWADPNSLKRQFHGLNNIRMPFK